MARYRIYLRDIDEQIISHGDTDHEACIIAESLIEPGQQAKIWIGMRRVYRIDVTRTAKRYRSLN